MDLSIILAAAEHAAEAAGEHEKSELPFFIAGALLVAFAILISVVGMRRPDFPDNDRAARGVMAVGAVLVLGAMSMIVYVAN